MSTAHSGTSLLSHLKQAAAAASRYLAQASLVVGSAVQGEGGSRSDLDAHQRLVHGLAWIATTEQALVHACAWVERLAAASRLGEAEALALRIGFGEYLAQLT